MDSPRRLNHLDSATVVIIDVARDVELSDDLRSSATTRRHRAAPGAVMPAIRRLLALAIPLVAASLLAAGPAAAQGGSGGGGKGGGGGGSTPTPPPSTFDACAPFADQFGYLPDGSLRGGAGTRGGCVIFTYSLSNVLNLVEVDPLPGWSYDVKSGGNTDSRIQVDFAQPATGDKTSIRMEPGKTVIT